jgi:hypothetical protein
MTIRSSLLLNVSLSVLALLPLCHAQNEVPPSFDSAIALVRAGMQANKTTIVGEAMDFNDKDLLPFGRSIGNTNTSDPGSTMGAWKSPRSTWRNIPI